MDACPGIHDATPYDVCATAPRRSERTHNRARADRRGDDVRVRLIAPPISRSPMAPRAWPGSRRRGNRRPELVEGPESRGAWSGIATLRRIVLLMLVLGQTWLACEFMVRGVLPYHAQQPLELAILCVFAILFAWISAGFWTALAGFATLALGRDRFA